MFGSRARRAVAVPPARSASVFIDQLPLAVQIALVVRGGEPVPRRCSTSCRSRRSTAPRCSSGCSRASGCRLVPLPALRDARDLRARVLGRPARPPASTRSCGASTRYVLRMSARVDGGARAPVRAPRDALLRVAAPAAARRRDDRVGRRRCSSRGSCASGTAMGRADRAESVAVGRRLDGSRSPARRMPATRAGSRPRSCTTSGKQASGYGTFAGRVVATGAAVRRPATTGARAGRRREPPAARPDRALRRPRRARRRAAASGRAPARRWRPGPARITGPTAGPPPGSRRPCAGRWPPPTGSRSGPDSRLRVNRNRPRCRYIAGAVPARDVVLRESRRAAARSRGTPRTSASGTGTTADAPAARAAPAPAPAQDPARRARAAASRWPVARLGVHDAGRAVGPDQRLDRPHAGRRRRREREPEPAPDRDATSTSCTRRRAATRTCRTPRSRTTRKPASGSA